jgi:predicted cupin superfamily sugar epimerase
MPLPTKIKDLVEALNLIPHPEGGFFLETFRSGIPVPMSAMGQTAFDCENPSTDLMVAHGRESNRPDGDARRNILTTIYWAPTIKSQVLPVVCNASDHVHFYHGGKPFHYHMFDPKTKEYSHEILGPDLANGHKLQLITKGGSWKCGFLVVDSEEGKDYEYCLLGESVAPGFDFHDFRWVNEEEMRRACKDQEHLEIFLKHVHADEGTQTVDIAAEYYEDDEQRENRTNERI